MVKASITAVFYLCATSRNQVFKFLAPGVHEWMLTDPIFKDMLCTAQEKSKTYAEGENHEYVPFANAVQYGAITGPTKVDGQDAHVVSYFELCDREVYARKVEPGCWYFTSESDQSAVVRIVQCILHGESPILLVECYKRNGDEPLMHGFYPVLVRVRNMYIHVDTVVRPAMVWHRCTRSYCEANAYSQCTRTSGTFVLNPFFLK